MEDVLDVYQRPYDARYPVVCMDETTKQLVVEVRAPLPVTPGHPVRYDHQYRRQGVANLFLRRLIDEHFPDAERITLVMENLNTHTKASLYETFEPAEAKRLADRLDIHHTPKHASWLNMAEIGFNLLSRQCLGQRIPTVTQLIRQVNAWLEARRAIPPRVNWQFTTDDARIKLRRLYPTLQGG